MSITAVPPGKKHRKKNKKAQKALKPQWSTYKRIAWLLPVFALFFLILLIRIFWLQVIDAKELQQKALSQWTRPTTVTAERGMIIDCNGQTLAKDGPVYKIVIWPNSISESDRVRVATELSRVLDLNYEKVLERVSSKKLREFILKRQVSKEACDEIRSLQLGGGVGISPDTKRYYPFGTLLSQTIGFTSTDGTGQSGLELTYNKYLTGKDGERIAETDSRGNQIADSMIQEFPPTDGSTLKLTVDANIQSYLENALTEAVQVNNAKNAQGIIMDVNTGAIVAISTKPDYDPNSPPRDDMQMLAELSRNRIVTDAYEPGSTFKILTLAAALDSGSTHLEDSFYCNGGYIVNGERIKCWKHAGHGSQNLTRATENSCNCCFMKLALTMGTEKFYDYLYAFGLGQSTGSGLVGESEGIVTHQKYVTQNDLARIGFGQSIAVTPIQLASAVCAAINGGELHTPYIVDEIISASGETVFKADTSPVRRVISAESSAYVRQILQSVVDNGTGKNAKLANYTVGGKTGTAQKYDEYGRVSSGNYICSFIGFAPADEPRYLCLILVDEPRVSSIFGSTVAAPFVRRVLENVLTLKEVPGLTPETSYQTVQLPDLVGMSAADASALLAQYGLEGIFECDAVVTMQVPAAGQSVVIGSSVLLYTGLEGVNTAEPTAEPYYVTMPSLIGKTALQAHDELKQLGLTMIADPADPFGYVIGQSIYAGTQVEFGSSVTVYFGYSTTGG